MPREILGTGSRIIDRDLITESCKTNTPLDIVLWEKPVGNRTQNCDGEFMGSCLSITLGLINWDQDEFSFTVMVWDWTYRVFITKPQCVSIFPPPYSPSSHAANFLPPHNPSWDYSICRVHLQRLFFSNTKDLCQKTTDYWTKGSSTKSHPTQSRSKAAPCK